MKRLGASQWFIPLFLCLLAIGGAVTLPAGAFTLKEEIDLGHKLNDQILKQTPLTSDRQALKEIDQIGQQLAKNVRRTEIKYHFNIIRDNDLNAFAIPGGYVYFTERLWNVMRRDERIGVLAHEIVHTDRRHALDAISKAQKRQIWIAVLLTAVRANDTWANLADIAHQLYTLKYTRGDEQQADEIGVELCRKAGLNPAGLLLAMRKIKRFQDERGGEPPKIFSSHPPSQERVQYLTKLLQDLGVPIPPEEVKDKPNPYRVGSVETVRDNVITFTSSKPLVKGDVVWLMGAGWDSHYENRTDVPIARGVVTSTTPALTAAIHAMPNARKNEVGKGTRVHAPPVPESETGVGRVESPGGLKLSADLPRLQRLLARQAVWNDDYSRLEYENVGYVVLTGEGRFVGASRPGFGYAPVEEGSVLAKLSDPDQAGWYGPVVSIGRSGQTIELMTDRGRDQLMRDRDQGKSFDILYPAWTPKETYENRLVGRAVLKSLDKKIVIQMDEFMPGWAMSDIQNGFDIYESPPPKDEN